jgi:RNA polymerase sigma-70 factor, ECF subfamily
MNSKSPGIITALLADWSAGNQAALDELVPLLRGELHALAAGYLRSERADHTLQPTALIHEMYLRLDNAQVPYTSRAHFLAVCAQLMRQVLVDHARRYCAAKRGRGARALPLNEELVYAPERSSELIALNDALNRLGQEDQRKSKVVELRFFGGLAAEEIAEVLGVSTNTVQRDWAFARAWLRRELEGSS